MHMQKNISPRIQRLFWDMDSQKLDIDAHAKTIIERVLNDGALADWQWLVSTYGIARIRDILREKNSFGRDNIRPQSRHLASLILK